MRTAAYARYSSDLQREASLEDQLRNVRTYCYRQGWPDPASYSDAAISGARNDRPGYRQLLADIERFDVLLVDDLSRLSRDSVEIAQTIRRLTFHGVRVIGVSDGTDTGRKGHKAEVGLRGIMSELYLSDLADKTHRGLSGRALSGASAGGLPYGYRKTLVGQRVIDEGQAAIVRRIFAEFIAGQSTRQIVSALNRDRIPASRGGTWVYTAVLCDRKRAIGILCNPIYAGLQIWNRSRWIKHPDSGRRVRQERPESEWIATQHPELEIVDRATWEAAQRRLRPHDAPSPKGPKARNLLSGIVRCGECGGPMNIINRDHYGCSAHKNRGDAVCASDLCVRKDALERTLLASVKNDLLSEESFKRFERAMREAIKDAGPDLSAAKAAIAKAETVHANIMAALRAGIITPSTKAELLAAEADIARTKAELTAMQSYQPAQLIPRAREVWRSMVATLESERMPEMRRLLQETLGAVVVKRDAAGIFAEVGSLSLSLVAGARSVHQLQPPARFAVA